MRNEDRARGYARGLVAVAEAEGALDDVEDELFAFAKAVEQNPELREALVDQALPLENKRALVRDVLGPRAKPLTATLIGLIVGSGRAREIGAIVEDMARIAAERRHESLAEARVAVALSDDQRGRLARALSSATGAPVELKVVVDPSVIGGVVARVGDEVFDGSVRSRLEQAREHLGA